MCSFRVDRLVGVARRSDICCFRRVTNVTGDSGCAPEVETSSPGKRKVVPYTSSAGEQ